MQKEAYHRAVAGRLKKISFSLSFQVIILIGAALVATALIQYLYAEQIIEETILDEVKKQAYVYLLGIERQVQSLDDPFEPSALNKIFSDAFSHDTGKLNFSVINIYMYDMSGSVIAYINEPEEMRKSLIGHYGHVLSQGEPYMGTEIEEHHFDDSGETARSIDIIIPAHHNGWVIGGIEVEINLEKTFAMIKETDNKYEEKILFMLIAAIMLSLMLIWMIMRWRLVWPVQKLAATTRQIAEGNFNARTTLSARNEIGLLSASVDRMADSIQGLFGELDRTYIGILNSLSIALEARDDYTAHHAENVTRYSLGLGMRIGLDEEHLNRLAQGAMLHDLGKIGIPDEILKKPGKLTEAEISVIQSHATVTAQILEPLEKFKHFSAIARSHHERWDGLGYPDGLRGNDIPILARIVAIADTWDAMTTNRFYRTAMSVNKALSILEKEKHDGQWDPQLLEEFMGMIRENNNTSATI